MDLLFKRYASPYLLIDEMLGVGKFSEFISAVLKLKEDDEQWEFYLHRFIKESFADFQNSIVPTNKQVTKNEIETTINDSYLILEKFQPESF